MRLAPLLTALFFAFPAMAQEEPIQKTIRNQIDAFLKDDFATAFSFASPNIRALFGNPENFGLMVRQGYPMVHRPSDIKMLELRDIGGRFWQRVMVTDQAGKTHFLDYQMIETPDGWQINGVQLLPASDLSA